MCIHYNNKDYCDRCKTNKEACKNTPMKKGKYHLSKYESVIGHSQASKQGIN